ncbi:hypothetical protein IEO21_09804 [Rhodonia placenta]|uniref:Uncharacterized protein n=1 Tax=Rhodonia placenta TaxID=104341 RepID=A0A8H7TXX0_9APHY|nr:hypothetical protein IEO21_09804 [Postia placenta]
MKHSTKMEASRK